MARINSKFRLLSKIGTATSLMDYPSLFSDTLHKLFDTIKRDKSCLEHFDTPLVISAVDQNGNTLLPAENAAGVEVAMCTRRSSFIQHQAVVESTGTAVYNFPYVSASGLELPLDADVTDGVTAAEIAPMLVDNDAGYKVGTDGTFFCEAKIKIDDVSDLDQLIFGFRKVEAFQAEPDNYDELAAWHIGEQTGGSNADGQINLMTILNGGDTSYTDTTETDWADAAEKTLRVEVDRDGKVLFFIDGASPTATAPFTFDAGEIVQPFLFYENTSGSTTGDPGISVDYIAYGYK